MAPYFIRNLIPRREARAKGRPLLTVLATLSWIQWGHFWSGYVCLSFFACPSHSKYHSSHSRRLWCRFPLINDRTDWRVTHGHAHHSRPPISMPHNASTTRTNSYLAWTCDAIDFFSVSLSVTNLQTQFGKNTHDIVCPPPTASPAYLAFGAPAD